MNPKLKEVFRKIGQEIKLTIHQIFADMTKKLLQDLKKNGQQTEYEIRNLDNRLAKQEIKNKKMKDEIKFLKKKMVDLEKKLK